MEFFFLRFSPTPRVVILLYHDLGDRATEVVGKADEEELCKLSSTAPAGLESRSTGPLYR